MNNPYGGPSYGYPSSPAGSPPGRVNWSWISESYNIFCRAPGVWIGTFLLFFAVNAVIRGILHAVFPGESEQYSRMGGMLGNVLSYTALSTPGELILYLTNWLVGGFQSAALYHMAVKQVRGETITFADIMGSTRYYGNMLVITFLVGLLTFGGVFLLCIGMFVALAFTLPAYAMVADGESAMSALSRSFEAMKSDWVTASLFMLIWGLLLTLSAVPCLLGFLVTAPMYSIISALAYRDMVGITGMPSSQGAFPGYAATAPGAWPPAPGSAPSNNPVGQYGQPGGYTPPSYGQPGGFGQPPVGQPQPPAPGTSPQRPGGPSQASYNQPPLYGQQPHAPSGQAQPPYGQPPSFGGAPQVPFSPSVPVMPSYEQGPPVNETQETPSPFGIYAPQEPRNNPSGWHGQPGETLFMETNPLDSVPEPPKTDAPKPEPSKTDTPSEPG